MSQVAGDGDRRAAGLVGVFQPANHVRRTPGCRQPDHQILRGQIKILQVILAQLFVVFRPFNGFQQRTGATGDQPNYQTMRDPKGWRTF